MSMPCHLPVEFFEVRGRQSTKYCTTATNAGSCFQNTTEVLQLLNKSNPASTVCLRTGMLPAKLTSLATDTIQKLHSMEKQADRCYTYPLPRRLMDAATWMCWSCSSVQTPSQSSARQHQSSQAVLGSLFLVLQHFWSTEQHSWSTAVRMLASSSCAEPSWPWASQASFSSLHSSLQPGSAPSLELP